MGSFSIWHWLIVLLVLNVPAFFVIKNKNAGPNRFGAPPTRVDLIKALVNFVTKTFNFEDRASRMEFWVPFLMTVLIGAVLETANPDGAAGKIWNLVTLVPLASLVARRLHDINRSGWAQLIGVLFPLGTIALIVWYFVPSDDTGEVAAVLNVAPNRGPAAPVGESPGDTVATLEKLARLKADGFLTEGEFEAQKRKLLGA